MSRCPVENKCPAPCQCECLLDQPCLVTSSRSLHACAFACGCRPRSSLPDSPAVRRCSLLLPPSSLETAPPARGAQFCERVSQPLPYKTGGSSAGLVVDTLDCREAKHICRSATFAAASYATRPTENGLDGWNRLQATGFRLQDFYSSRSEARTCTCRVERVQGSTNYRGGKEDRDEQRPWVEQ